MFTLPETFSLASNVAPGAADAVVVKQASAPTASTQRRECLNFILVIVVCDSLFGFQPKPNRMQLLSLSILCQRASVARKQHA